MADVINTPREDWAKLEERVRRLALEKSYLQLVIHLINNLSEVPGLERTTEAIVRVILDNLGGTNVALYFVIDTQIHYVDAYGERKMANPVEDSLVGRAFAERELVEELRDFADTKMATPEFTKAAYWALPLMVGQQLVGVLKMEGMLMAAAEVRHQLQPFFNHAAVILKNEVESYRKIMEASQLAAIVQSSDDAIIGKSLDGLITSWNKGAERIYGYTECEVIGHSIALLTPPGREGEIPQIKTRLAQGQWVEHLETLRRRKDGQIIHVSLTVSPILNAAGRIVGASTIARDITERIQAEEKLRRLNRELRALSTCNEVLMRAVDEPTLLNDICRIVCQEAGYPMAWVGYAEHDHDRTVRAVAWAGSEDSYLAQAQITWADTDRGCGPSGIAIRTGQSACIQDFAVDPQAALWRDLAKQHGFRSNIALPLKDERGTPFGVLSIYSSEPNAFTSGEVRLLEELSGDLAYGLNALRTRTQRLRAEAQLYASEERLRLALDAAKMGQWEWNIATGELAWSPQCLALYGLSPGIPMSYARFQQAVHPDDWENVDVALHQAIDNRKSYSAEKRAIWPDGSVHWIAARGQVYCDTAGQPVRMLGVSFDITERKQAEEERQSHLRFLESMDKINRAIQAHSDLEQMMSHVLEVVLSLFDCDRAWLFYPCDPAAPSFRVPMEAAKPSYPGAKRLNVDLPMPPDMAQNLREALDTSGPVTYTAGTHRPVNRVSAEQFGVQALMLVALNPKKDRPWALGLHQCSYPRIWSPDEERLIQEIGRRLGDALTSLLVYRDLRESEERFRDLYENAPNAYFSVGVDGRIRRCNRQAGTLVGYAVEKLLGKPILELYPDTTNGKEKAAHVLQRFLSGETVRDEELQMQKSDGRLVWISLTVDGIRDAQGKLVESRSMVVDITERKQAEAALQVKSEELDRFFTLAPDLLCIANTSGFFLRLNPAWEHTLGFTREELLANKFLDFVHSDDRPATLEALATLINQQEVINFVNRYHCKDGTYRWIEWRSVPSGRLIYAAARDITERKWTEEVSSARIRLAQFALSHTLDELLQATLDETERLTGSTIGFFHFLEADQRTLSLQTWSTQTLAEMCTAEGKGRHYDLDQAGVWVDCVRERRPVIHNDYASLPHRKGMPQGHAKVIREAVVPIFRGDKIVAVLGVGNKPQPYVQNDIEAITLLSELTWDITERIRVEEDLHKLNLELDRRVKERTAELENKNRELERMNKLFVGRELRMAELKKRIKTLGAELDKP